MKITEELRLSNRYRSRYTYFDNGLSRVMSLGDSCDLTRSEHFNLVQRQSSSIGNLRISFIFDEYLCHKIHLITLKLNISRNVCTFIVHLRVIRFNDYEFQRNYRLNSNNYNTRSTNFLESFFDVNDYRKKNSINLRH